MKSLPFRDTQAVYQAMGPQQLAALIRADWRLIEPAWGGVRFTYLKQQQRYAEMIARQWEVPLHGAGYVVRIVLPECMLRPPRGASPEECPAVVGGNVETSQRIVDVLLGAIGRVAASQGTMNNVAFGDDRFALSLGPRLDFGTFYGRPEDAAGFAAAPAFVGGMQLH